MSESSISQQIYTTFTRDSVATELARGIAGGLLRWSEQHSRVVQLSHEEMALRLANERVLDQVHEGRFW
ncbi:MAG: hypothetical protein QOH69_360 [Actinomycetota bacterium]|nr:hypothetical protein [Actinomycetota bacterium]